MEQPLAKHRPTDEELFNRFLDGDDTAFMTLYDCYHPQLLLYCQKILGNMQQAEDMMQELWEKVIRFRTAPQQVRKLRMFLITMARNQCLNAVKADRRFSSLDYQEESTHPAVTMREMSHLEELVVLSLPRLSFEQREVLVLNVYCNYRFDEIAEMLGDTVTAVRMRASRARANLGRVISAMIKLEEDREQGGAREQSDSMEDPS